MSATSSFPDSQIFPVKYKDRNQKQSGGRLTCQQNPVSQILEWGWKSNSTHHVMSWHHCLKEWNLPNKARKKCGIKLDRCTVFKSTHDTYQLGQLFSPHNMNMKSNVQTTVRINRAKEDSVKCEACPLCSASPDSPAYLWRPSMEDACSKVDGQSWLLQISNDCQSRSEGWPLGRGWSSRSRARRRWVSYKVEKSSQIFLTKIF